MNPTGYNAAQYGRSYKSHYFPYLLPQKSPQVGWLGRRPVAFTFQNLAPPPPTQQITAAVTEPSAGSSETITGTVTPQVP